MPEKAFAEIARQLGEVVSELQETLDHEVRLTLLRHILLLILEAGRALDEEQVTPPRIYGAS